MVSPELKFALFQLVIILPFLAGSILNNRIGNLQRVAKPMISLIVVALEPPIILWSILGLEVTYEMAVLPVAGATLAFVAFFAGKMLAGRIGFEGKRAKVYVICSSLANQGFTMGGFICYLFAGERGLALSAIFMIYFIPFTFLFMFAYAGVARSQLFTWSTVKGFVFTYRNMPVFAVFLALTLKLSGVERPDIRFPIDLFLVVTISLYYLTLGINFNVSDLNPFKKEHLCLGLQKFVLIPSVSVFLLHFLSISAELKQVILIESFMPVAVYAVITSILFDLDSRKASSLFVVNSLAFIFLVFPVLFLFRSWLV